MNLPLPEDKKLKILILSAPIGSGHQMAANALEEALLRLKNAEVTQGNVFDFFPACGLAVDVTELASRAGNALADAFGDHGFGAHVDELILQRRAACIDNENFHDIILQISKYFLKKTDSCTII